MRLILHELYIYIHVRARLSNEGNGGLIRRDVLVVVNLVVKCVMS